MDKERRVNYELGTRRSIPVILEIKEGNTFVNPTTTTNKLVPSKLGDWFRTSVAACSGWGCRYAARKQDPYGTSFPPKLEFNSLTSCIAYLHSVGLCIKRDTLSKYIKLGKVFHNFYCKYLDQSDLVISDERERIGLLIEEYKKTGYLQQLLKR